MFSCMTMLLLTANVFLRILLNLYVLTYANSVINILTSSVWTSLLILIRILVGSFVSKVAQMAQLKKWAEIVYHRKSKHSLIWIFFLYYITGMTGVLNFATK